VDSEPDFADTVAEYLAMQGDVDVVQAIGPLDVGYAIGAHKPKVVLFDVDSPGVEMRDLGRLMRSHCRSSRLFILTSISDPRVERMALEFEGCELIQKPVKLDRLWKLICAA
jgi:DNA-binding response OmpR family regulator